MSVAVITERAVVPGRERVVLNLLRKLQNQASAAPGFVNSIAYRDLESPQKLVVISKWNDPASWNSWARQLERSKALDEMREVGATSQIRRCFLCYQSFRRVIDERLLLLLQHLFGPITHRILLEEKEETFLL